jgi:glycine/D-amino acid oxidase-like deaminating enzyme
MRKWMKRTREAIREQRRPLAEATARNTGAASVPIHITARETRATALHMRLRERKRRQFVRAWIAATIEKIRRHDAVSAEHDRWALELMRG